MRIHGGPYGEGKAEGEFLMYWIRAVIIGPKERQGWILKPFPLFSISTRSEVFNLI